MSLEDDLTAKNLIDWKDTQKVLFASDNEKSKKLYCTLWGGFEVYYNKEVVFETINPYDAIKKYKEL